MQTKNEKVFFGKEPWDAVKKNFFSENFINRLRTPEKQNKPPTLWNRGSQGPLTIKTIGNSGYCYWCLE